MMHSYSTMVTHVKGLTCLLSEYKKNHEASDSDGELIYNALFISAYTSGVCYLNILALFLHSCSRPF